MSIVPAGGWNDPQIVRPEIIEGCPECGSDDWKAASLVHAQGLSLQNSNTRGRVRGLGLSSNRSVQVGVASYGGRTRGTTQTVTSRMAAPPQASNGLAIFLGLLLLMFGLAAVNEFAAHGVDLMAVVSASLAALSVPLIIRSKQRQQETYTAAMEDYAATRMCQRCGTFYRL
jgi:hypothetical protein